MQEILINIEAGERRVAILRSKKLEWYFVERMAEQRIVGNVYKGKVSSVLNGMGAAFIECGLEKNGFLYVTDITTPAVDEDADFLDGSGNNAASKEPSGSRRYGKRSPALASGHKPTNKKSQDSSGPKISDILKKGQEITVQIVKEGIGTKGARITTHISLPGRYLVVMPMSKRVGVSRRIKSDEERTRLKGILRELKLPDNIGLVARTAAEGAHKRELLRDGRYLLDLYRKIEKIAKAKTAPALLFEELDLSSKTIRDFVTDETTKVIVDEKVEFKKLKSFAAKISPTLKNKIYFHKDHVPLFEKHNVEKEIDKLFERKVFLKCGGYITIEQTEGMIAIDVNSGRFTGKKNLEDTIFKVNQEAAEEVARQLRLRDIGGIVVIDFIDMESQKHRNDVFGKLRSGLRKDKARTHIVSLSELDIVEMTRQRVRRSLESVSYEECPYCRSKGMVKSEASMAIMAMRNLKTFLKTHRSRRQGVELIVHPNIAQRLVNEDAHSLDVLRKSFRRRITVVSDDNLHIEDVNLKSI